MEPLDLKVIKCQSLRFETVDEMLFAAKCLRTPLVPSQFLKMTIIFLSIQIDNCSLLLEPSQPPKIEVELLSMTTQQFLPIFMPKGDNGDDLTRRCQK